jgi:histidinol-phosphate aminotransferase
VIHLLGVTLLEPGDEVIQGDPSFVRYQAAAILNNAPCHLVPLTADWVHDLDAMAERANCHTRLVFIANPNNPTGTIVGRRALERLLDRVPERALVVLDEAYYEYAAGDPDYPDCLPYVREGRNIALLRTFSKVYGLAGHRIGYGVMPPEIAQWLNRVREPFNVNYMAQAAAVAALGDTDHVRRTLEMNAAGKRAFYAAFDALGLPYAPTHGNFVWVDVRKDCKAIYEALLHRGVIIRTGDIFGAPTHLRVTIGTAEENARFLNALQEVLPTIT